jgi:hypothetical protein
VGDALDLDPRAPAAAHVDIGAGGADAGAHMARAPVEETDVIGPLLHLVGVDEIGIGDSLNERHPEAVGAVDANMTDVGDLAAGVLFQAELDKAYLLVLQLDLPFHPDDRGALEAGGDGAVEVLLARDMDLPYYFQFREQGDLERLVEGLAVEGEGWGVVNVVGACGFVGDAVNDLLAGLELHEGGAVVFA